MVSTAVCCLRNIKISIYKTNSIFCCCMGAKLCFHEVKLQAERVYERGASEDSRV